MQYDLSRYVVAHEQNYQQALAEIQNGKKISHWMWYIFPQLQGLGKSPISQKYAIKNLEEAKSFLAHPYLGSHLMEISNALLKLKTNNPREIFRHPDDMKLKSSMTLFSHATTENQVFLAVLEKYYDGKQDSKTLMLLGKMKD